jgi:hypothetical protein
MSDDKHLPEEPEGSDDPIARLIRAAGPRASVPEERERRVRSRVQAHWSRTVNRARRARVAAVLASIAAALFVAVGIGLWLRVGNRIGPPAASIERIQGQVLVDGGRVSGDGAVLAKGTELLTGPDGRAALRLGKGFSVRLDFQTGVRPISDGALELDHGAVYVDTGESHGTGRVIQIHTRLGRVTDVGTQFEVRLADDRLDVKVREGLASLDRDGRAYTAPAGARLEIDSRGEVQTGQVELHGVDWQWPLAIAPPFELEGRTLREYVNWLSRETGWRVEFTDPSISAKAATIVLHGSTSGLRPDETPGAVLPTCGLRHRVEGETLVVEPAAGGIPNR